MSSRPEAFGRELLRLTQGIDANDEWAERAYILVQSPHAANPKSNLGAVHGVARPRRPPLTRRPISP